jgi:carbamoyltransferase
MYVLGINAYHPDASVVLLKDGVPIWAAEEERFNRIKHSSGFPKQALVAGLNDCRITASEINLVAISKNPRANLFRKLLFVLRYQPALALLLDRAKAFKKSSSFEKDFFDAVKVMPLVLKARFVNVEHHQAHVASSYFVSGFEEAAFLSLDGMGDFSSAMWGFATKKEIKVMEKICFPHSAGFFYTAGTQFLGFKNFGDEYKVMGLAAYGKPVYVEQLRKMINFKSRGRFSLNLNFFRHHKGQAKVKWQGGAPDQEIMFSKLWEKEFGLSRDSQKAITQREKDLAASMQQVFEEIYFHVLNDLHARTGHKNLCLAGGCALNSLANGKIKKETPFENVYIQAASNDSGTALGAAIFAYNMEASTPSNYVMKSAALGNQATDKEIELALLKHDVKYKHLSEDDMLNAVVEHLEKGEVVGWFQGRMELGPRALGNRSILADARRSDMKDILNERIKQRETFRPFAPAIPVERAHEFFEMDCDESPFMLKVFPVKNDKIGLLPAITHVDHTARVQTVSKDANFIFWKLLNKLAKRQERQFSLILHLMKMNPLFAHPKMRLNVF